MKKNALIELKENLIPFYACRVSSNILWCSDNVIDLNELHNECSYYINPSDYQATKKIFYAERYGGSGIQRNGGGARCGFDGKYQIKGIGANLLVGEGTDDQHSNGILNVVHAIYEMLWSEALEKVLPYGTVRTLAILLTNESGKQNHENFVSFSQRALLVREPVVRAAHFARAPYFIPQSRYASEIISDAERVKRVIRKLPNFLPTPPEGYSIDSQRDPALYCIEGMCELARRLATQLAFCRTRFLRLTTSPSNICIDGRLMDFNGLNSLFPADYQGGFEYQLRYNEMIKEPAVILEGMQDVSIYLGKYLFMPDFSDQIQREIKIVFDRTFENNCVLGYLNLIGITQELLGCRTIPPALKKLAENIFQLCINPFGSEIKFGRTEGALSSAQSVATLIKSSLGVPSEHLGISIKDTRFKNMLDTMKESMRVLYTNIYGRKRSILNEMADIAQYRLQPRKVLNKNDMFRRISRMIDEQHPDVNQLQLCISNLNYDFQSYVVSLFGEIKGNDFSIIKRSLF